MFLKTRPKNFHSFVGQKKLKKIIKIIIASSLKRKTMPDHILLFGPSGSGKTTIANIISNMMKSKIKIAQGPLLQKKADFLSLFAAIKKNDVIFIDEFHGINKNLEELLYSVLEDFSIDIILGVDGDSRIMKMKIPTFTLIAATTKHAAISKPIHDRFGFSYFLEKYNFEDIAKIITKNLKYNHFAISKDDASYLALYANNNPRIALNILKRVVDFAIIENNGHISKAIIKKTLKFLNLYELGLNSEHIRYLKIFIHNQQQCFSLKSLANILSETNDNVMQFIEPMLIKLGFIELSSRGRKITNPGKTYLDKIK